MPDLETLSVEVFRLKSTVESLQSSLKCSYLCAKGVQARYGWSERTFYRNRHAPGFPQPVSFPGHLWRLADLLQAEQAGKLPSPAPDEQNGHGLAAVRRPLSDASKLKLDILSG